MREHIGAHEIANEARLVRSQHSGTLLIVEGDTDSRLYRRLVDATSCEVIVAHSKDNAVGAIGILDANGFAGVLAVVDADFCRLECAPPASPNVLVTDTHDLETMILASPALDKIIDEYCSPTMVERLTRRRSRGVRGILLETGRPIGYLRWLSQRDGLSLVFECLAYRRFINTRALGLDTRKMVRVVKNKSQRHDLDEAHLRRAIADLADPEHDPWDVCCGHDLVRILSLGLSCGALGGHRQNDVQPEAIERVLRIAYDFSCFATTALYQALRSWEDSSGAFRVLPVAQTAA